MATHRWRMTWQRYCEYLAKTAVILRVAQPLTEISWADGWITVRTDRIVVRE